VNLLFLTQTYPRFEGDVAGPFIRDLARGLVRGGDRVTVATPHAPGLAAGWDDGGVEVVTFRYAPERWEVLGYGRSLEADEAMKPGALAVTPLYLAAAARTLRRLLRRAARTRPYDLVHAHWVVPNGPPAAWATRPLVTRGSAARVPLAVGLHGSDVFLAERPGVRVLVRRVLGATHLLTGCSPELVRRVAALGMPEARCRVIPYGVDVAGFAPDPARRGLWRGKLGIPDGAPLVLGVGRMATKKGFHVLMQALPGLLARHPRAHLVLAGAGDRLEELRRGAAALPGGAERVHFPGAVLRDTLPDLYRAADVFVLPAVHDPRGNVDGLPNVILEAMACALPVVASGISGIPLAVEPETTGLLVPEGRPDLLAAALDRLLADPPQARAWGRAGRAKAERELTWDAVAARYREGYQIALERGRPRR
jgi:glycosyltransferase involved in cell wall biosynthesis